MNDTWRSIIFFLSGFMASSVAMFEFVKWILKRRAGK